MLCFGSNSTASTARADSTHRLTNTIRNGDVNKGNNSLAIRSRQINGDEYDENYYHNNHQHQHHYHHHHHRQEQQYSATAGTAVDTLKIIYY